MRSQPASYHGYRFPPDIISHAVWLYHRALQQAVGKMTEGPSSAVRSRLSNHPKRLSLRVAVVSVGETSSMTRQVWIRKTNASEPPLTRREPVHDIETDGG